MPSPYSGSQASNVSTNTGDYRSDALVYGTKWGGPAGTGATITYSFPDEDSSWSYSTFSGDPEYRGLTAIEQDYARQALSAWANVANIDFQEVADNSSSAGALRISFSGEVNDRGAAGMAYYPSSYTSGGDVWLAYYDTSYKSALEPGTTMFWVALHEIGHALGLKHPHAGSDSLPYNEANHQYSVMAYQDHWGIWQSVETPMVYDILAVQHLYGANYSYNADDTTYTFPRTEESLETLWDGGGIDTLDTSDHSLPVEISLIPGTYSSIGPSRMGGTGGRAPDNVGIAFGAIIENAIGGSGDDTITGNDVDNVLEGGAGDDRLFGGAGDDRIDGGTGFDTAVFSNALLDYTFVFDVDDAVTVTSLGAAPDGRDLVFNVEAFQFDDLTYSWGELHDRFGGQPPVNAAPVASDDVIVVTAGETIVLDVLANDYDPNGDPLTLVSFSEATHGEVTRNSPLTYRAPEAPCTDQFTYTVSDGEGETATATVEVTVVPADVVRLSPEAFTSYSNQDQVTDTFAVDEGGLAVQVAGNTWKKVPFSYTVTTDTVLEFDFRSTSQGEIHGIGFDDNNDLYDGAPAYKWFMVYGTQHGSWNDTHDTYDGSGEWQHFRIDVGELFTGPMNYLTFVSDDDRSRAADSQFRNIRVFEDAPDGSAPLAADDAIATDEDTTVAVSIAELLANDEDADGDALTLTEWTQPTHGAVIAREDGTLEYLPDPDFHGTDSFTYTVTDGSRTDEATVSVTVAPVNDAPVAVDDSVTTEQGQPIIIKPLANDSDPEGDDLALESLTGAENGTVTVEWYGVTYTPADGFTGEETLTYVVRDASGATATADITVTVTAGDEGGGGDRNPMPGTEARDVLRGSADGDDIDGFGGDDWLYGKSGDDAIDGGAGHDILYGDDGDDVVFGGAGDDMLKGGDGADRLDGGAGDDRLYGDGGPDTFVYTGGSDRIFGFERGHDTIRINGAINGFDSFAALDSNADGVLDDSDDAVSGSSVLSIDFGQGDELEIWTASELDSGDLLFA